MKKDVVLLLSIFLLSINAVAQNSHWIFAPKKIHFPSIGIPIESPLPNSSTLSPQSASNIQMDAQGNILFYVIDKDIFDKEGLVIGSIGENLTSFDCLGLAMTSEIIIMQNPNDCNIYYVFCNIMAGCPGNLLAVNPYYSIVDFNQYRPNSTRKGKLTLTSQLPTSSQWIGKWYGNYQGGNFLAASTLKISSGNKFRLLFVNDPYEKRIVRFKLDANGLIFNGTIPYQYEGNSNGFRAEMELIDLPNGRMRIAAPYCANGVKNGKSVASAIFMAELDANGNVYNNQMNTLYFYTNPNISYDIPYIHGLEFSPNGDNLFISHVSTSMHSSPFEYYSFSNPNASDPQQNGMYSVNMNGVNSDYFQYSQIEYTNNKLYLGSEGRLASFSNPNTPNTGVFIDYAITLTNYDLNYGNTGVTGTNTRLYTLQDQIDGMDYQNFTTVSYNLTNFTATTSGTWMQGVGNNPWNVNTNEIFIESELIIPSGKTITIKNMTFRFGEGAKVLIKQGGKLILDGCKLTSTNIPCNNELNFWQGVEVWGTSSQHQSPESNPTYQGRLELINGGTIENAHLGAINWKDGDYNSIGGVIYSNGGKFINNRRDVSFMVYENFNPSNVTSKLRDYSSFYNTDFTWNTSFIPNNFSIQPHVSLWAVHGINFINCRFTNTRPGNVPNSPIFKAISSIDASYSIGAGCSSWFSPCPNASLLKSSFTGFHTAIEASGSGTTKTVTIAQSDFSNNIHGIVINEFNNVSINRNNLNIGSSIYPDVISGSGISVQNSTGYIIEENNITTSFSSSIKVGISISNSGIANNRLYKNTLTNLSTGNNITQINRDAANSLKGLQFLCNTYNNNTTAVNIGNSTASHGVRPYQGEYSPIKSAGNIFNNNTKSIFNGTINPISYYHTGGTTIPTNNTTNVTPYVSSTTNACKSSFSGVILLSMKTTALDSLENQMENLQASHAILQYNYQSLIDGGNTDNLKEMVENNWSEEAWELRAKLLEKSPYLSEDVLLDAAKLNLLPNAMLLEICIANPDATKGIYFKEKIYEATHGNFPEYMHSYIRNSWDTKTLRTQLEAEISELQTELATTKSFIHNLKATADDYTYKNRYEIVKNADNISDKIGLLDYFIEMNQWQEADSVLTVIYATKNDKDNLQLVEDFDTYIQFRASLGDRSLAQLDDTEISYLQDLAMKNERVAGYAKNILCFFYAICFDRNEDKSTKKMVLEQTGTMSESVPALETILYEVNAFPNPAKDFVNVSWKIMDQLQNCHFTLVDLNGAIHKKGSIDDQQREISIDTRSLSSGIYILSIYNKDAMKVSKKIEVKGNK